MGGDGSVSVGGLVSGLKSPSPATLKKYGLSLEEWWAFAKEQDYACAVCGRVPSTGRLCVDHEHVKNWAKMPPERRKLFVRGLLDWTCNHYYVGRGITVERSENVTGYLRRYAARRPTC